MDKQALEIIKKNGFAIFILLVSMSGIFLYSLDLIPHKIYVILFWIVGIYLANYFYKKNKEKADKILGKLFLVGICIFFGYHMLTSEAGAKMISKLILPALIVGVIYLFFNKKR